MASSESPIFPFPGDDPEMEQAATKARQTFRFFWRELSWERRRIVPGLQLAAIKGKFTDPPEVRAQNPEGLEAEHMWLLNVDFDGRQVKGTLINSPHSLKSFNEGDEVKIPGKQIYDWMYVVGGSVCGGFTVDVLRSRMNKKERKQHDQAWGFDFGEVGIVNVVPPDYLGEAQEKKKGLLSRFSAPKETQQDFRVVAAAEHPMSLNMRESYDKQLAEDQACLHEFDENGFGLLHDFALAGSLDGVEICLKHGADPSKPAANGMTPHKLAKVLGWKKVMARIEAAGGT